MRWPSGGARIGVARITAGALLHNLLMRFPDSPDIGPSSEDSDGRAARRDGTPGLTERLLRLPAGHPSGADARPVPADSEPEDAVSHLPWPDDWVRHDRPDSGDAADADQGEVKADDQGEVKADAGGQPEGGKPGVDWPAAGRSPGAGAEVWESRGPYRPWFTDGDVAEPWFAGDPDWPSSGQGG